MKVWRCDVFAKQDLTLPCVTFIGKFPSALVAMDVLLHELSEVQVLLYPGPMQEAVDDHSFTDAVPFRMSRLSSNEK